MTYATIHQAVEDVPLQNRVQAGAVKEAFNGGPEFVLSEYGERLRTYPSEAVTTFMWPVAIDYEAAYQYAVDSGDPDPGGDATVITDANIQACVQAHWPVDTTRPLPPDMNGPTPALPILPVQPMPQE